MRLSTVTLAVLLLLDFKPSRPGNVCSWGASAYFRSNGEGRRRFIRLGDVNIGAILYMTKPNVDERKYVGVEQKSQVWFEKCLRALFTYKYRVLRKSLYSWRYTM